MRTMVEPAATAASRSSLIPIERSSNSRSSAKRRTVLEGRPRRRRARCRHGHETAYVEPERAQFPHQLPHRIRRATVAAGQAASCRPGRGLPRPARRARCARPRPPGPRSATGRRVGPAGPPCSAAPHRGNAMPRAPTRPVPFAFATRPWPPARRRSSRPDPEVRPPAPTSTTGGPKPLVTPMMRTRSGSPPACSMRWRTRTSRCATARTAGRSPGGLAEEGGDVEIVVTQVELVLGSRGVGEDVDRLRRVEDGGGQCRPTWKAAHRPPSVRSRRQ